MAHQDNFNPQIRVECGIILLKMYLREDLLRVDENWIAARFDSLPHVVHILTSKDRDAAAHFLKEQSDIIEDVVDEVVHSYHSGFNRAIQNYSQILKLFSESTDSISVLKVDLAEAKKRLSARNKQLHQLWYRSVTLRHIISLLDQIEDIAKVPARIEKLITEKQFYAAVQLDVQSILMLERGLQNVGALQDVRSDLTKLRGVLFYKILEDLHAHLYNKGEYSAVGSTLLENDDEIPTTIAVALTAHNSQSLSRRTRSLKGDNKNSLQIDGSYRPGSMDGGSFDGHEEADSNEEATSDVPKDSNNALHQMPSWLLNSTPDEFLETITKSDAPLHVKYLQTMVECLCILGKVAAAGAVICQRLRPTIHEIITSKIRAHAELLNSSRSSTGQGSQPGTGNMHFIKGQLESYQPPKQKRKNGISIAGTLLAVSPVSPLMAPGGKAQVAARELLDSIFDAVVRLFENHIIVGELLEAKANQHSDINTPKSMMPVDVNWNPDSEASQVTGGYSIGFSLTSECQQLICEILRATPEAASADAAVQTARLASKVPSKDKRQVLNPGNSLFVCGDKAAKIYPPPQIVREPFPPGFPFLLDGSEDGLTFAFRFTDATISIPNQGVDHVRQGWSRKGPNVLQEGYGSAAVLPEEGIYLAASIYRPVLQFTDKLASMLPTKYSQLG
ncbi:unnamed protein product [Sphenostylis stenocarpa]|uniref:Exocyst complex component Sec8 n=1 Tax=Sphenostylis stenocarpa TaxID=92480 RepID=A0AA87B6Y7_9FABA|nr:unnamed protein product [Sphenostylis stenocarpa]